MNEMDKARRNLEAIIIRCREGDPRSDWLPTIDRLATETLEFINVSESKMDGRRTRNT